MDWTGALAGGLGALEWMDKDGPLGAAAGGIGRYINRRRIGPGQGGPPNTAPMNPNGSVQIPGYDTGEDDGSNGVHGMAGGGMYSPGGGEGTMYGSFANTPMGMAAAGLDYVPGQTWQTPVAPPAPTQSPVMTPGRANMAPGAAPSGAGIGPRRNTAPMQGPPGDNRPLPSPSVRYNPMMMRNASQPNEGVFRNPGVSMGASAPPTPAPPAPPAPAAEPAAAPGAAAKVAPKRGGAGTFGGGQALARGGTVSGMSAIEPQNQESAERRYSPISALPPSVSLQPKPEDMAHRLPHRMSITPRLKVKMPHPSMGSSGRVGMGGR